MDDFDLSVVLPCRDRTGTRLTNCLQSLRWQDLSEDRVEIILSDFGSSKENQGPLDETARRFGCTVVRTDTGELWNRSRALNTGIQAARSPKVLCTDVDMIFAPSFLSTVLAELETPRTLVLCRCRDLPQEVPHQLWKVEDYPRLLERSRYREFPGTGACQATERDFLVQIRGYDERYVYWGYEDRDMVWRAKRAGLRTPWIHERTSMLHQWHPKMDNDRSLQRHVNRLRYFFTGFVVKKNRKGWGNRG